MFLLSSQYPKAPRLDGFWRRRADSTLRTRVAKTRSSSTSADPSLYFTDASRLLDGRGFELLNFAEATEKSGELLTSILESEGD